METIQKFSQYQIIGHFRFGEDRKSLASLSAIIVATGEVAGGLIFGFLAHLTIKWGRHPVVILGFILSLITYALMFINFPMNATLGETSDIGYIEPSKEIALTTSFILGFSDACFNTQVNDIKLPYVCIDLNNQCMLNYLRLPQSLEDIGKKMLHQLLEFSSLSSPWLQQYHSFILPILASIGSCSS